MTVQPATVSARLNEGQIPIAVYFMSSLYRPDRKSFIDCLTTVLTQFFPSF